MQLPHAVRNAINQRAEAFSFPALKRAATALSGAYREGKSTRLRSEEDVVAYLVTRMPATYAAARSALDKLPDLPVTSVLDIGAGSGSATLAARDRFSGACEFTLMERDCSLADTTREWLPQASVMTADVESLRRFPTHDLVIAAYSLGELSSDLTARLWDAARVALLVIEPGTPRGFARVLAVRDQLIGQGAAIAAPCPGAMPCPLAAAGDWCHFAARVERTSLHRKLKAGELGHEDEKFSYVALAREGIALPDARVVRHPRQSPGLIELTLCTHNGLRQEKVTKRDKDQFRAARKADWGASWIRRAS